MKAKKTKKMSEREKRNEREPQILREAENETETDKMAI